jgi:hypothetical protein
MKSNFFKLLFAGAMVSGIISCQKEEKPALGDYPEDVIVTPTTPLRFFVSFDSTTEADKQINIRFKDNVSGYPSFFPDNSITYGPGVGGTGSSYVGNSDKNLVYYNSNDFVQSSSFSVAFWMKHDGAPPTDAAFIMSIPSTAGHWSNSTMLLILDNKGAGSTKDSAVFKLMVAEVGNGDHWFELTGKNRMANVLDNQWHHLAFAYDETTSNMKIYRDGQLYSTQSWAGHGKINMDASKVTGFYLGGKTTDWGKAFDGGLDQFRLYNKALTDAEVMELFTTKQ